MLKSINCHLSNWYRSVRHWFDHPALEPVQSESGVVEIVLAVLVIIAIGAAVSLYMRARPGGPVAQPAKNATTSPAIDPTSDWVAFASVKGHFSLKYPKDWNKLICNDTDAVLYLGPTNAALAKCSSDFLGQMMVFELEGGTQTQQAGQLNSDFANTTTEQVTIDGVLCTRATGTLTKEQEVGSPIGTFNINYACKKGNRVYVAIYQQHPSGAVSQNLRSDFDLMIKSTLKFTN